MRPTSRRSNSSPVCDPRTGTLCGVHWVALVLGPLFGAADDNATVLSLRCSEYTCWWPLRQMADNDNSGTGQRAAETCARRWVAAGREARLLLPHKIGADFNDIIVVM